MWWTPCKVAQLVALVLSSKQRIIISWQALLRLVGRISADHDIPAPWDDPLM